MSAQITSSSFLLPEKVKNLLFLFFLLPEKVKNLLLFFLTTGESENQWNNHVDLWNNYTKLLPIKHPCNLSFILFIYPHRIYQVLLVKR